MPPESTNRPLALYALILGLLVLGLGGILGGYYLVLDSTGKSLGLPLDILHGSAFPDFMVPGVALLVLLGLFPLLVAAALWRRSWWALPASVLASLTLLAFLGVEILVIGYVEQPPFQLVFGVLGVVLLALSLSPPVRRYCQQASLDLL